MKKRYSSPGRLHPLALALTCVLGTPVLAQNLPTGFTAITGVNAPTTVGKAMTVTQTAQRGIAQWQGFSIAKDYSVNVVQPNKSSVLLNRVVGGNASTIAGALNANGHVYLINPNGVLFSRGSSVNAGGLIASTLNLSDKNFLAGGRLAFERANTNTATVRNEGAITAAPGGTVALLGARVSNDGNISAPGGSVGLVSARKVNVDFDGDGLTTFTIPADSQASGALVDNSGSIDADGGRITLQAASSVQEQVVNQRGVLRARSISSRGGQIVLGGDPASGNAVQIGGSIDVSGNAAGGSVQVSAAQVQITGAHINANGNSGGTVAVDAANGVTLAPDTRISAEGASGAGGSIAISGQAGDVVMGASTGQTPSGAWLSAASSGGPGGNITVSGRNVGLFSADTSPNSVWLDASGAGQGGSIAIRAHADPGVASSGIIAMDSGIGLHADATSASGNGGNITLLGDSIVRAHGTLTARAGATGGDGGMVETSAPTLELAGIRVDASAPAGAAGNWLLDPYDVNITHGSSSPSGSTGGGPPNLNPFDPATECTTVVYDGDISAMLSLGNNVTITTGTGSPAGVTPPPNGDITFVPDSTGADVAIRKTAGGPATLTLNAAGRIMADQGNPSITSTAGPLNVEFTAGGNGHVQGECSICFLNASAATNGGNVTISATTGGVDWTNSPISTQGGNVTISAPGGGVNLTHNVNMTTAIDTQGGAVTITGTATDAPGVEMIRNIHDAYIPPLIQASTGNVQIHGTSANSSGVAITCYTNDCIRTTSGSITVTGVGGNNPGASGVALVGTQLSSSMNGVIAVYGLSRTSGGTASGESGVVLNGGASISTPIGGGDIDVAGRSEGGAAGVYVAQNSSISGGNNVVLRASNNGTADALVIDGTVNTGNMLNVRPGSVDAAGNARELSDVSIVLGGSGGGLSISSSTLDHMNAQQRTIVIGSDIQKGNITVAGDINIPNTSSTRLTLQNGGGGNITLNAPVSAPVLGLVSAGNITQSAAANITATELFALSSSGNVDLQNASNGINTVGGSAAGSFAYATNNSLSIGSIIDIKGYNVADHAPGDITTNRPNTLSADRVTVHAGGDLNLYSTVNNTSGVELRAGGNFTLGGIQPGMSGPGANITAGGPVRIEANLINVTGAAQGGQITTNGGDVTMSAATGGVGLGSQIATNGGNVTMNAAGGNVVLASGSQIATNGGDVTMNAATGGVGWTNSQISTSGGNVTISATGGGVTLTHDVNTTAIDTQGATHGGTVTITGTATDAPGVEMNRSVHVANIPPLIKASTGNVQIDGTSANGTGVTITCYANDCIGTTSGSITLTGVGANSRYVPGVALAGTQLSSEDGAIAVYGLDRTASGGSGVVLNEGASISTGGSVKLDASNVSVADSSRITTNGSDVAINGIGDGVSYSGQISTNGGNVAINGTDYGVSYFGQISTNGGNVAIKGSAPGDRGGSVHYSGQIATNGGDVTIEGTGYSGISMGGSIDTRGTARGGAVTITGTGEGISDPFFIAVDSFGVYIGSVITTSTGDVQIRGVAAGDTGLTINCSVGNCISTTSGAIKLSGVGTDSGIPSAYNPDAPISGVLLSGNGTSISSEDGAIVVYGLSQASSRGNTGGLGAGVVLGAGISTTGHGDIDVAGRTESDKPGVSVGQGSVISGGNNVVLRASSNGTADALVIDGTVSAKNVLNVRPGEVDATGNVTDYSNVPIVLGGSGGGFSISSNMLEQHLNASTVVVGSNNQTGDITVAGPIGNVSTSLPFALMLQNDGGGNITLNAQVFAPLLGLLSAGHITQSAAAEITADGLFARSKGGNVDLQNDLNRVHTLGGGSARSGSFAYASNSTDALSIGVVSNSATVTGYDAAGNVPEDIPAGTLSAGGVTVHTGGDLNLTMAINSASDVFLDAISRGNVTQNADITANGSVTMNAGGRQIQISSAKIDAGGDVSIVGGLGTQIAGAINTSGGSVELRGSSVSVADGSRITTSGSDVAINGTNSGVSYSGQTTTNGGNVTINGTNRINRAGTGVSYSGQISTNGGDVNINGGGRSGVDLNSGSGINTEGGAVTIVGTQISFVGTYILERGFGVRINDGIIAALTGDVQIDARGITGLTMSCTVGNCIRTTSGSIALTGISSSGLYDLAAGGVILDGSNPNRPSISTVDGAIAVHGLSQAGDDGITDGLGAGVTLNTSILATGHGDIDVAGRSESNAAGVSVGQDSSVRSTGGNVTLRASNNGMGDALVFDGTASAGNTLNLRPGSVDTTGNATDLTDEAITVGGPTGAGFSMSSDGLSRMSAPTIVIGSDTHAADITVAGAISTPSALTLQNQGGGNITLDAPVSASRLGLVSAGNITQSAAAEITADGLFALSDSGNVDLENVLNHVHTLGGGAVGPFAYTSNSTDALRIDAIIDVTGYDATGNAPKNIPADTLSANGVTVHTGGDLNLATAVNSRSGVELTAGGNFTLGDIPPGVGANITASGPVRIEAHRIEVTDQQGWQITTHGGEVTLSAGDGGVDWTNSPISTQGGDVTISATGGGVKLTHDVNSPAIDTQGATRGGTVTIRGTATDGPGVALAGARLSSADGAVAVYGLGGTAAGGAGVVLSEGARISTTGSIDVAGRSEGDAAGVSVGPDSAISGGGNVVLRASHAGQGDALVVDGTVSAGNVLNLRPGSVDVNGNAMDQTDETIVLGGPAAGAGFSVSSDALSRMSASTIVVGSNTQAADITVAGAINTSSALTLQNEGGGNITLDAPVSAPRLGLVSAGGITQATGADITAGELLAQASGGDVNLQNTGNAIGAVGGSASGNFTYTNANALTIGPVTVTGYDAARNAPMNVTAGALSADKVQISTRNGDLTLTTAVSSTLRTDLIAAGTFQNPGSGSISGPWRIWADTWDGESRGGLEGSGDFPNLYGCIYLGQCAATASTQQDNHFIYKRQPTITVVIDNQSRPFGADNPELTYSIGNSFRAGDQRSITGTPSTQATPSSPPGSYPITGDFISAAGYAINVVPGELDVFPLPPQPPNRSMWLPEELLNESDDASRSYERAFGLPPVCPNLASSLGEQRGGDMLGHEWLRVRLRHKVTSCIDTERRNGCTDF